MGTKASYLKLLSGKERLMLDALDGTETLAEARDVFWRHINRCFKDRDTNKPSVATKEQAFAVYELKKDATFAEIFAKDTRRLWPLPGGHVVTDDCFRLTVY